MLNSHYLIKQKDVLQSNKAFLKLKARLHHFEYLHRNNVLWNLAGLHQLLLGEVPVVVGVHQQERQLLGIPRKLFVQSEIFLYETERLNTLFIGSNWLKLIVLGWCKFFSIHFYTFNKKMYKLKTKTNICNLLTYLLHQKLNKNQTKIWNLSTYLFHKNWIENQANVFQQKN